MFRIALLTCLQFLALRLSAAVWPHPKDMKVGDQALQIQQLALRVEDNFNDSRIRDAIARMRRHVFGTFPARRFSAAEQRRYLELSRDASTVDRLVIQLDMDRHDRGTAAEAYRLSVQHPVATLSAATPEGILHGLETFAQLIEPVQLDLLPLRAGAPERIYIVNATVVHDEPRFAHRGVLIDTSRHWLPPATIRELLNSMSWSKLNVLHWHLTDDPSAPFQSERFPDLSTGAFHPSMVYSKADIEDLVQYAYQRGIRVYVELDTPAHAKSLEHGLPGLLTRCNDGAEGTSRHELGPVNPARDSTYERLAGLYREVSQAYPGHLLHLGGDEVDTKCWAVFLQRVAATSNVSHSSATAAPREVHRSSDMQSNTEVRAFMSSKGIASADRLQHYFTERLVERILPLNRTLVLWQDAYDAGVALDVENTVIQVWKMRGPADAPRRGSNLEADETGNRWPGEATTVQAPQHEAHPGAILNWDVTRPRHGVQEPEAPNDSAGDGDGGTPDAAVAPEAHSRGAVRRGELFEAEAAEEALESYERFEAGITASSTYTPLAMSLDTREEARPRGDATQNRAGYLAELAAVTRAGYRALLSSPWYLDAQQPRPQWQSLYMVDPTDFEGTTEQKARVMGGEACIWGEWVDGTNLMTTAWPRLAAVAERLWTPAPHLAAELASDARERVGSQWQETVVKGFDFASDEDVPPVQWRGALRDATSRMHALRCRMLARGARVAPGVGWGIVGLDRFDTDRCHPQAAAAAAIAASSSDVDLHLRSPDSRCPPGMAPIDCQSEPRAQWHAGGAGREYKHVLAS